jgi:hypothetical protein
MRRALSVAVACLTLAATALPQTAYAGRYDRQERFMGNWCAQHPRDRDCRDWSANRHSWNEDRYRSWYGRHRHEFGPDDAAASIFGFAAGVTGSILNGISESGRDAACAAKYGDAYNPRTNRWTDEDGDRHRCRL